MWTAHVFLLWVLGTNILLSPKLAICFFFSFIHKLNKALTVYQAWWQVLSRQITMPLRAF